MNTRRTVAIVAVLAVPFAACGDDGQGEGAESITLVAYSSFPAEGSHIEALAAFTEETGVEVDIVNAGDAGTMVSKAVLTAGNPEGDVMFGVDNTYLSRVVDEEVFEPYEADGLDAVPEELRALVPDSEATPVDYGDVCINYDIAWFEEHGIDPPADLEALAEPRYRELLVVENPATETTGLAFLLATVATFGEDGWTDYWTRLRDNGVEVVDGWEAAYYERFSGASDGPKPLVVSYGTSPPVEVLFADPPIDTATTAVVESTCFRQVEFAGVLRGTDAPHEAEQLVDFLISERFQAELPLNLFVYPANGDVALPPEFTEYAVQPDDPATLDPATIAANRESWIDQWSDLVLR
ncbi:MAG TPA: thiamine ABC transporter substrate-binding protein [Actinomycetota bacterium]|nr:thiamine ABC transporter substrate-binding protein [Actinomycetota bacterium]